MSGVLALPPLATITKPNASVIFKGEAFPIFKEMFVAYSRTAAEGDRPIDSEFVITSSVARASVKTFIDVCQAKSPPFDKSQIVDLLSLCEEWSVDSLKSYLLDLIECDHNQVLTALRYASANGFRTQDYEDRVRRRFSQFVDKDELLELPVSILRRIIDVGLQDTDFDTLFKFLTKCFGRFGSCGSILFEGVELRHFSVSQLQELLNHQDFLWCYLSDSVCDTISLCMSEMAKHRTRFEDEHRELCDLQTEYRRVVSDYEASKIVQGDLMSRLSSFEASLASLQTFQSSTETRLALVESESARKADLESHYATKSDLQSNYATKSDLQSHYTKTSDLQSRYATKSDLQSNYTKTSDLESHYTKTSDLESRYAMKSDLQSNYAKKSDLPASYATKSDLNNLEGRCASKAYVEDELSLLRNVIRRFVPVADSLLKGIISHLTTECGGNVHDRGVVTITANRPFKDSACYAAKNIADLEADSWFCCANESGMRICYDFKNMKVVVTHYSIRSRFNGLNNNLKSWVIEVSLDGEHWTVADRRNDQTGLCAQNVVRSFPVSKQSVGPYVRLCQNGPNNAGSFDTMISGFELFGGLML
jgi:hypothetical protein